MLPVLFGVAAVTLIYYFYSNGSQAEACGHCCCATAEGAMKLSYNEILGYAQTAGFGDDAPTAAAIALAESGGDPTAYNKEEQAVGHHGRTDAEDGKGSYGLMQIYLFMHPEFEGQDLTDPQTNMNAGFSVYSNAGNGFRPWSTFSSGAYEEFLQ